MQFFFQVVSQRWKRNQFQVARDMLHVGISSCNLQWFRKSLQSMERVEQALQLVLQDAILFATCTAIALPIVGNHFKGEVAFTEFYHVFVVVTKG